MLQPPSCSSAIILVFCHVSSRVFLGVPRGWLLLSEFLPVATVLLSQPASNLRSRTAAGFLLCARLLEVAPFGQMLLSPVLLHPSVGAYVYKIYSVFRNSRRKQQQREQFIMATRRAILKPTCPDPSDSSLLPCCKSQFTYP